MLTQVNYPRPDLLKPSYGLKSSSTTKTDSDLPETIGLGVAIANVTSTYTEAVDFPMSAPHQFTSSPYSLLVLLPSSSHYQQHPTPLPPLRPSPLTSRQSSNSISTVKTVEAYDDGSESVVLQSRRLSLAPGIGSGTQTPPRSRYTPPSLGTVTDSPNPQLPFVSPFKPFQSVEAPPSLTRPEIVVTDSQPPAFGARKPAGSNVRPSRRRPVTAATGPSPVLGSMGTARGSMALPSGMSGGSSRSRPGWEGDEVVNVLRGTGLEVTVLRHSSHLAPILSPQSTSPSFPSFGSRPSTPTSKTPTHVILVPLGDSPTLPSLSLVLAQGTTPTAVCFQQDLLERAKRTEDEWLPTAIAQLKAVCDMRDRSASKPSEQAVVLAYSANPALSSTAVAACVSTGAAGVLKPPFDENTARLIQRMVKAAQAGRISSVVGLNSSAPRPIPSTKVVLPPTALSMGAEHEGEKILSDLVNMRRRNEDSRRLEMSVSTSSSTVATPTSAHPGKEGLMVPPNFTKSLCSFHPTLSPRRRSVDTGGLALALKRATTAYESPKPIKEVSTPSPDGCENRDTLLAELLSAMYYQTTVAIEIQMSEYQALSAPLTSSHREKLVDAMSSWNFKPHALSDGDLFRCACLLFEAILNTEGLAELNCSRDQVNRLLFAIRAIYHAPNPYHNYVHAIDVLQATYTFLIVTGVVPDWNYLRDWDGDVWKRPDESVRPVCGLGTRRARDVMRPQDVLGIMIAAMGHDVGHPGLSNAFMKNAKTPLSQVYDDKSVLENMHCMLIIQLLRKHGFGFLLGPSFCAPDHPDTLANPARELIDWKGFRRVLYSAVLATDMSLHFAWIQRLKHFGTTMRLAAGTGVSEVTVGTEEEDRIMICQALIKCADISNPTRPIDVSEHWSSVLLEEWAKQASLEQELDLPVSVIASADAALQAKGQVGFIDLFTQPLFEAASDAIPELQTYADSCSENRSLWQSRLDRLRADVAGGNPSPETLRLVIQPVTESCAHDQRFRTLFPLSLPSSLAASTCLEPGPSTPTRTNFANDDTTTSSSPAAKAMRAVYHSNILEQRYPAWSGDNLIPGISIPDWISTTRRMSTPDAILSQGRS